MDSFVPGGILVDRNRNARGRESIAMRKHPNEREYWDCVSELLADGAVQAMRLLPQHRAGVSCFDHSVLVSRISWRICRALGLDERAAARGGLLHDLYLYNWREKSTHPGVRHGTEHPAIALDNARARFPLTWKEADIIATHMFPYTPTKFYHCLESAVVSTVDKLCAAAEVLGLVRPWAERVPLPAAPEARQGCTP